MSRIERGIIDLTVRCVETVRSEVLTRVLRKVVSKLIEAVWHPFTWRLKQVGRPLAERTSEVALSWHLKEVAIWKKEVSFIQCLGLNYLSSHMCR